jgi:hypothetical protein
MEVVQKYAHNPDKESTSPFNGQFSFLALLAKQVFELLETDVYIFELSKCSISMCNRYYTTVQRHSYTTSTGNAGIVGTSVCSKLLALAAVVIFTVCALLE